MMSITAADVERLEQLYFEARFADLELAAQHLVTLHPEVGFAWSVLGTALQAQGKPALHALRRSAELLPDDPSAQAGLGDALFAAADYAAAITAYQKAQALYPSPATLNNLGNAFKAAGDVGAALQSYEEACDLDTSFALAWYNLGLCHRDMDHIDTAVDCLRKTLALDPSMAVAHAELGALYKVQGRLPEAIACLESATQLDPELGSAHTNLGAVLVVSGRFQEALTALRQAVGLLPQSVDASNLLALALEGLERSDEALAQWQISLQMQPDNAPALARAANLVAQRGELTQALNMLRIATRSDPTDFHAASALLFYTAHTNTPAADQFAAHVRLGQTLQSRIRPYPHIADAAAATQRPLRVGLVSGDFCNHIVARCLVPILCELAKSPRFELFAYYNNHVVDDWTKRVQALISTWRVVVGIGHAAIAAQIANDKIDILMDLSGHTGESLLEVFAHRPAPVQVSWLGYPWTSGLGTMDYYLADTGWLPEGRFDGMFTERLAYVPAWLPFRFEGASPEVTSPPCATSERFVFGSFNHFRKIHADVLDAWANILLAVPQSQLALGGIDSALQQERLLTQLESRGVTSSRLVFWRRGPAWDYLQLHNAIDLCLDAFPFPSATTIQHALWMGVPTITIDGPTPIACAGAGIMRQLGLDAFVAKDAAEYVALAQRWADHRLELGPLRQTLRGRLLASPMGQPHVLASQLEMVLLQMHAQVMATARSSMRAERTP